MNDWKFNEATRAEAEKYIAANELTQAQFTKRLAGDFSTTRVAKYLNLDKPGNKAEPDAAKVEAAIHAFLRHVARGMKQKNSLYENSVTRDVAATMRQIRRTGDIGVIVGDGGYGKTSGAILFCRDNPDSLYVVAKYPYGASEWDLMRMVFDEFCASSAEKWDGQGSKWEWLEKQLRGTERLLIVDDAELLYVTAFRWLFSLQDATGLPICLIGNNEVVEKIAAADRAGKMISRIGLVHQAQNKNDEDTSARYLVDQFTPGAGNELVEAVTQTICEFGHSRRARKQLTLAANIREGGTEKDWLKCYIKAGTKLINSTRSNTARKEAK